jgi:hypothetical protein
MKLFIVWLRNNIITIVEAAQLIYQGVELILNGVARLIPGNTVILQVHAILKKIVVFEKIKKFLLAVVE